jgi:hypothetical protein
MDTQITTWEMNLEPAPLSLIREEIAKDPSEPYSINMDGINWN